MVTGARKDFNQPESGRTCDSFVQYKNTDICIDVYCACGIQLHYDGYFAYALRCWSCEAVWALPTNLALAEDPGHRLVQDTARDPDETEEESRWRDADPADRTRQEKEHQ